MLNDGSYGFWLTIGVVRQKFYLRTIVKFTALLVFAEGLGLCLLFYMNQFVFDTQVMVQLFLSISSSTFFLVVLAVFISNRFRNPEFSSIAYLSLMGLNIGFNNNPTSPLYFFFQSDLAYRTDNAILSVIFAVLISVVLVIISLRIHLKQDIHV